MSSSPKTTYGPGWIIELVYPTPYVRLETTEGAYTRVPIAQVNALGKALISMAEHYSEEKGHTEVDAKNLARNGDGTDGEV